jgi:hypothetical protein
VLDELLKLSLADDGVVARRICGVKLAGGAGLPCFERSQSGPEGADAEAFSADAARLERRGEADRDARATSRARHPR